MTVSWTFGGIHLNGGVSANSSMPMREPFPSFSTVIRMRARPRGHPAADISRSPAFDSMDSVSSLSRAGHTPTEWWIFDPACGHEWSTSRMREAPTTHEAYSQPLDSTDQTCAGVALV